MNGATFKAYLNRLEFEDLLDEDSKEVCRIVGKEKYMLLLEEFGNSRVYFSREPIMRAKRTFVREFHDQFSVQHLARLLDVSERWVYKVIKNLK